MEPDITQPDGSKEDRLRDEEEEDEGAQLVYDSRHELSFSCFIKHGGADGYSSLLYFKG